MLNILYQMVEGYGYLQKIVSKKDDQQYEEWALGKDQKIVYTFAKKDMGHKPLNAEIERTDIKDDLVLKLLEGVDPEKIIKECENCFGLEKKRIGLDLITSFTYKEE